MKVPFLPKSEIENEARAVRQVANEKGIEDTFPLEAISIVEFALEYELTFTSKLPEGVEGETDWQTRTVYISDKVKNTGRQRFTIAHEIGHIALHIPLFKAHLQQTPLFRHETYLFRDKDMEWQADYFASCILMPRDAVLTRFGDASIINVNEIMSTYGTSREAATIRMKELGLLLDINPGQRLDM